MRKKNITLEKLLVEDYAAEGKALSRVDGKVIFIEGAIPGDIVDVRLTKNKKDWAEGKAVLIHKYSAERVDPFCEHFGVCGGCKWQMLPYEKQLQYKQQEVEQHLKRIGKVALPAIEPILGCTETRYYRNKLEFTCSNRRYLLPDEIKKDQEIQAENAIGFHVPRIFDKVIDIYSCHLMHEPANLVRNTIREYAAVNGLSYYDIREHVGFLRTVIVRVLTTGEVMVNVCFGKEDKALRKALLDHLLQKIPAITTLLYTINQKWNDSLHDQEPITYYGKGYALEKLEDFRFKIGPKSFFQTNTRQGEHLYQVAREFAELTGKEIVYDLYCGTGSIGIFVSKQAAKVIGVEVVAEAIADAKENASLNQIEHADFFAGDVIDICDDAFFASNGRPDVIITDPPRAGMHEKLVQKLLEMEAPLIVYVSCNPATQARDLNLLDARYIVTRVKPVDMFPHTHHIENVVQLKLRK
ncbi:23S rRNA (uracil(1939)-C(5))-methyltransferase RlmD [Flavihumibacter profundi]|jgi:23S rRNA (uracil1939-C5)-methyltransferase|uniref:23S rRNA (uracil(1939)-C(5))-methyltransferase RlmD n=1 Tax=Flavihumibacter profundi TaxID=2716883 RepID=UPI001CC3B1A2|nr:23S rRNA (uracil(1939)-C(5))-methyltransferase RlmD [Flavihumibacter profundi]MBZ5858797.1 23S rRNA (uracil(1939)-C(5))-methyltransferase RlmD [Flavihumibacter profundi]